jgi:hypothetical protein
VSPNKDWAAGQKSMKTKKKLSRKMTMKKYGNYRIWIAALVLLTPWNVFACSCFGKWPGFADAHEVFAGKVIDILRVDFERETEWGVERRSMKLVTFQVIETWKGENTITKVVGTGLGGGDCGVEFEQNSKYLVYTYPIHAQDPASDVSGYAGYTGICSPTGPFADDAYDADQIRKLLGEGQKPLHPLLKVLRNGGTTTLSWQTNWVNFRLESTESLQPPVIWRPVSNHAGTVGGYHVVTNETTLPRLFFRLAR